MGDLVSKAQAAVPQLEYMFAAGRQLPQTTRPDLIAAMLRLLHARRSHRILEIGTGSGYSTALLAQLTGRTGRVTSLDIDPELISRAAHLLHRHGYVWVSVACADGRDGWLADAPYDRLVAWASSPETIPTPWLPQMTPGGVIVAPVRRGTTGLVLALQVDKNGALTQTREIEAGFVPLTSEPFRPWERQ